MIDEKAYKEAIEQWEKDWSDNYEDLLEQYGDEFLDSQNRFDDRLYSFDEYTINELFSNKTPFEMLQEGVGATVNWSDDYFYFDGYGHIHTEYNSVEYYKGIINEDEFKEFILKNDYFDDYPYPEEEDFEIEDEEDEEDDNTTDNN